MGSDLTKESEPDLEKDFQDEYIKYGIISKKCKEQSNDDNYIISANNNISEGDISINYSLFGIFDGHNGNYVSKYLSENIKKFFEKEIKNIDINNCQNELGKLFTEIDNSIKEEKNKDNEKNEKNNIDIAEIEVKESDKEFFINSIKNSSDIPDEFKEIDNNELEDLLLFRSLFDSKNNYIHNINNLNYIGSSASLVLINSDKIITMNLGLTKCYLFDKEGNILNVNSKTEAQKEQTEEKNKKSKNEHSFNNIEEKIRIKKFNKDIDYESLKINSYIPTSRSFGFYKYKSNELLNSNNQIISCIPDIEVFNIKNVYFIFLVTGLDLSSKRLKKITKKIKALNLEQNEEIKYTKIIEDLLPDLKKEKKSKKEKEEKNEQNDKKQAKLIFENDDIEEENILLEELDNEYYKDVFELNKPEIIQDKNTTCILIKLCNKNIENKKKENKENTENKEKIENTENNENKEKTEIKENQENIENKEDKENTQNKENIDIKENQEKIERKENLENNENIEKQENIEKKENIENKENIDNKDDKEKIEIKENKRNLENNDNIENKENLDNQGNIEKKEIQENENKEDIENKKIQKNTENKDNSENIDAKENQEIIENKENPEEKEIPKEAELKDEIKKVPKIEVTNEKIDENKIEEQKAENQE